MRGQVLEARERIQKDTGTHDGMLFDLVNDERFKKYQTERNIDPLIAKQYAEYIKNDLQNDPSRLELQ